MGSLRREIPMDISRDCGKCGFPVDEAAQVLEVIEQVAADILPLAQVVLGDQLLHPGCRGGRGAAQRSRRRRTSCDEVEERSEVGMLKRSFISQMGRRLSTNSSGPNM